MHKGARTDPCGGRGVTRAPTAPRGEIRLTTGRLSDSNDSGKLSLRFAQLCTDGQPTRSLTLDYEVEKSPEIEPREARRRRAILLIRAQFG